MGGTEKECDDDKRPVSRNKEDVSEAIISKLLKDFNSAALLKGETDPASNASDGNVGCEEIASSLKHLHLGKSTKSRQKFKERRKAGSKAARASSGNEYDFCLADVPIHRPVLWPAKLDSSSKKDLPLLHFPKLSLFTEEDLPVQNSLRSITRATAKQRAKWRRHHLRQRGSLSESRQQCPSFSCLSEKPSYLDSQTEIAISKRDGSRPLSSSSVKRPNSCPFPVAKHPRLYNEIHVSSDIAQFLDFRCPSSPENNNCASKLPTPSNKRYRMQGSSSFSNDGESSYLKVSETPSSSSVMTSVGCGSISNSQDNPMDESNVNELASYFDDLLHIPKKMSAMAEMMYA